MSTYQLAALVLAFHASAIAAAPAIHPAVEPSSSCLSFDDPSISLSGTIFSRIYFGPPGYGLSPQRDVRERAMLLLLDAPLCVQENSQGSFEGNVIVVQLAAVSVSPNIFANAEGHRVTVRGSLFHSLTGHHRTAVLMDVHGLTVP